MINASDSRQTIFDRLIGRRMCVIGGLLLLLAGSPAHPALVSVGDAIGDGWIISSIDAGITLDFTATAPAPANSSTRGVLVVDVGHTDLSSLKFGLRQTTAIADISTSSTSGGLRLLMNLIATDNGARPWTGYLISALELSHVDPTGLSTGTHLQDAHFHNTAAGFAANPLVLVGMGDNLASLAFGMGTEVAVNDSFTVDNILLHERYFEGMQRNFEIELQPISEPPTLLILVVALLLLQFSRCLRTRASALVR